MKSKFCQPYRATALKFTAVLLLIVMGIACSVEIAIAEPGADQAISSPLNPKRVAPAKVDPVLIGKLRFEAIQWGKQRGLSQNGGYIAAYDANSSKELWILKVYEVLYDPALESDVQDIFIISMSKTLFTGKLIVKDEKSREYVIDPEKRKVETKRFFSWL